MTTPTPTSPAFNPMAPDDELKLSPTEQRAADPEFAKANPELSVLNRHQHFAPHKNMAYLAGDMARPALGAVGRTVAPAFNNGAGIGALAGGAAGYLGGKLGDKLIGMLTGSDPGLAWKLGLLGAGAGGFFGHQRSKIAAARPLPYTAPMTHASQIGLAFACAAAGVRHTEFVESHQKLATIKQASLAADAKTFQVICKMAATLFDLAGRQREFPFHVYTKLASLRSWNPLFTPWVEAVVAGLAHNPVNASDPSPDAVVKFGAALTALPSMVAGGIGRLGSAAVPAALTTALAASAGIGAGAGSLYWLANRHVREDDNENEALRQKRDYYRKITGDIADELRARDIAVKSDEEEDLP